MVSSTGSEWHAGGTRAPDRCRWKSLAAPIVRRMKTKWGTCVTHSGTIWLNPEPAKMNPRCLEYIVVHELVHLQERGHGPRFVELMDHYLPDWRARRDESNAAPLAAEHWV